MNDDDCFCWVASYGSNLSKDRLNCYIQGGKPHGSQVNHDGCKNKELPKKNLPVVFNDRIHFAGKSTFWKGGSVSFIELPEDRSKTNGVVVGNRTGRYWYMPKDGTLMNDPVLENISGLELIRYFVEHKEEIDEETNSIPDLYSKVESNEFSVVDNEDNNNDNNNSDDDKFALGRMYLMTQGQFKDLLIQENTPGCSLSTVTNDNNNEDDEKVEHFSTKKCEDIINQLDFDEIKEKVVYQFDESQWYGFIYYLGEFDGYPIFTITGVNDEDEIGLKPNIGYLRTISKGLIETYYFSSKDVIDYFQKFPSISSNYTKEELLLSLFPDNREIDDEQDDISNQSTRDENLFNIENEKLLNDYVWYSSYGSNMFYDRFNCYIKGGKPPNSLYFQRGCYDCSTELLSKPIIYNNTELYFAKKHKFWDASTCYLNINYLLDDSDDNNNHNVIVCDFNKLPSSHLGFNQLFNTIDNKTNNENDIVNSLDENHLNELRKHNNFCLGRMYLIKKTQFIDIVSQENLDVDVNISFEEIINNKHVQFLKPQNNPNNNNNNNNPVKIEDNDDEESIYSHICHMGDYKSIPIFTFSDFNTETTINKGKTSLNYLKMLMNGLKQCFKLSNVNIAKYLYIKRGVGSSLNLSFQEFYFQLFS